MSWSPDVYIGEMRPWPDTVHVVRGKTDEMRRYVPEMACESVYDKRYYKGMRGYCEGRYCSKCKEPLFGDFRFCPWCGRKITGIRLVDA